MTRWNSSNFLVLMLGVTLALGIATSAAVADHCRGQHRNDPGCSSDDGGGSASEVLYQVAVVDDTGFISEAPVYNPTCDAFTVEQKGPGVSYSAFFDRHDLCATVTTSDGMTLTDDIVILASTDAAGDIVSVQLGGQDTIGKEGIYHESEIIVLDAPVTPLPTGFTIMVDRDLVPVYKCDKHLKCVSRVDLIGYIALDLLIYSPTP